ncbi:MAG: ATP-binding protein [Candidatus Desulfofervidus auxilii]|nr:ATP-binding protein [Candidatus Desulfofervidus auxilii]
MILKSVIIGGNEKCLSLLKFIKEFRNSFLKITALVEKDLNAPAIPLAQELGISIKEDYRPFLEDESLDIIINFEQNKKISHEILDKKLSQINFLDISNIDWLPELLQKLALEKKLKETSQFLSQRYETIGTMVSGIAHEFNNLLMIIMGYAQLIAMQIDEKSPHYKYFSGLIDACNQTHQLIEQLLTFARQSIVEKQKFVLAPLVKETVKLLKRTIPENINIHLDIHSNSKIEADPTQIQQVILNLATNACDAMPEGGDIYIRLTEEMVGEEEIKRYPFMKSGEYICLSVKDTGEGIPKEIQHRIFDPFFTTKGPDKGTGMGLATVYGIVKQVNGYIVVESDVGKGAEFKIYFPLIKTKSAETLETFEKAQEKGILIVEDEEELVKVFKEFLEELGYKVFQAQDGEEGWLVFVEHEKEINLVVLDIVMPKASGIKLAKKIKVKKPDVKIILMTGYNHGGLSLEEIGAEELVEKPFSVGVIAQKIQKLLA